MITKAKTYDKRSQVLSLTKQNLEWLYIDSKTIILSLYIQVTYFCQSLYRKRYGGDDQEHELVL